MIPPALFDFFRDLSANNNRDWFNENRSRYEQDVKAPLLDFIAEFAAPLYSISPHFLAIPKVGGSLFRIYRDVRFSKDKRPYKEAAGIHFRHEVGKDAHAPGFYLHLEPGEVFAALGIWAPGSRELFTIRKRIVDEPDEWLRITRDQSFLKVFSAGYEHQKLKRAPKGFDPNHPLIEDLKCKHFVASSPLTEEFVSTPAFSDKLCQIYGHGTEYMKYLTQTLGHPW
ncbi:MAG: DUF2461 domain-containing protein [Bacteroidetes bacterium]|nr:DUF2461 domain-containing protein [Bacteroidota bacterium]MCY4205054.1 DUF2461 domain-containing protein [Bacteroidota bacterium]